MPKDHAKGTQKGTTLQEIAERAKTATGQLGLGPSFPPPAAPKFKNKETSNYPRPGQGFYENPYPWQARWLDAKPRIPPFAQRDDQVGRPVKGFWEASPLTVEVNEMADHVGMRPDGHHFGGD